MTRNEHLLTILSEECSEVAHRVSKTLRFTPEEIQPGQPMNNAERILQEFCDLAAAMEMLEDAGVLPDWSEERMRFQMDAKKIQVEKFLEYSKEVGTLTE
jgi:hypothetical protein